MPTPNVTLEQLYSGIERPAGKMHKLVLKRIPAHFLELDVGFGFKSGVLLPTLPIDTAPTNSAKRRSPPFFVLKQVFDHAEQNPGKKLLIAGHTDTAGSASVNRTFSQIRASSVYGLLKGDRELWAKSCERRHEVSDIQTILRWAAREHGFGCDPGEIDGLPGPKTLKARERFRQRYNDEFAGHLKVIGPMTLNDWKAFFDLYEVSLARMLGVAEGALSTKRAHLSFVAEPVLGCGEHWPVAGVGIDGLKSTSNRRVDFVFFDEEGFPSLQKQEPPGYELYGMALRFRREVIEPLAVSHGTFTIDTVDGDGNPVPDVLCEVATPGGDLLPPFRTDAQGRAELQGIATGMCVVRLPELEGTAWRAEGASASRPAISPRQDHVHLVKAGDTLTRIAWEHGIHGWERIWNDARNETLRASRANPNVLLPGDRVFVRGCTLHEVDSQIDGAQRIVIEVAKMKVRVRLQDLSGEPYGDIAYDCSYRVGPHEVKRPGTAPTDADGWLEEEMPVQVETLTVTLKKSKLALQFEIGHLTPWRDERTKRPLLSGLQARLGALGYNVGPIDGKLGPRTREAVRQFQCSALERDNAKGAIDAETCEQLARLYGV